jgi:septum formation protein
VIGFLRKSDPAPASWRPKLALASASPRRLALLQQIGVEPDSLLPADLDETPQRNETPRGLAVRLADEKARAGARAAALQEDLRGAYVIAADTVVSVGRRILPKCEMAEDAGACLRLLSGRNHRVFTAVTLVTPKGAERRRLADTRVRFKRLSSAEIEAYLASGEWRGKAGGYAIQGLAGAFVTKLVGSYTGVVGLPLNETAQLLAGEGYPVHLMWLNSD